MAGNSSARLACSPMAGRAPRPKRGAAERLRQCLEVSVSKGSFFLLEDGTLLRARENWEFISWAPRSLSGALASVARVLGRG